MVIGGQASVAALDRISVHVIGNGLTLQIERCLNHIETDKLAFAGVDAMEQSCQGGHGQQGRAIMVYHRASRRDRRSISGSGDSGEACHRLDQKVLTREVLVGSAVAVSRSRDVDKLRISLPQLFISDAQPVRHTRAVVLNNDVGFVGEPLSDGYALRMFEIDCDTPAIAIGKQIENAAAIEVVFSARPMAFPRSGWRLYLYDIRAQIREMLYSGGSEEELSKADDADAIEYIECFHLCYR